MAQKLLEKRGIYIQKGDVDFVYTNADDNYNDENKKTNIYTNANYETWTYPGYQKSNSEEDACSGRFWYNPGELDDPDQLPLGAQPSTGCLRLGYQTSSEPTTPKSSSSSFDYMNHEHWYN